MGDAPAPVQPNQAASTPSNAVRWGCLAVTFVLGLVLAIDPVAFGAGIAVARVPDQPTPLPEPVVTWGRINDPPDKLRGPSPEVKPPASVPG